MSLAVEGFPFGRNQRVSLRLGQRVGMDKLHKQVVLYVKQILESRKSLNNNINPNDVGSKVTAELCKRHASLRMALSQSVSEYMDSKNLLQNENTPSSSSENAKGLFQILHLLVSSCSSREIFDNCITKFFECFDGKNFISLFCMYDALLSWYEGSEVFFLFRTWLS